MMEDLLGTTLPVFIGLTVIVIGFASWMTGQAIALTWRPQWQLIPYALLLGVVSRFLTFALFDGALLSLSGYLINTLALFAIALFAYRLTRARKMLSQYPWLYEPSGLLGWRNKSGTG